MGQESPTAIEHLTALFALFALFADGMLAHPEVMNGTEERLRNRWRDSLREDFHPGQHPAERFAQWLRDNRHQFTPVGPANAPAG